MNATPFVPEALLVTGGCGFIGSNFIRMLLTDPQFADDRFRIINLDKLTYAGNLENLTDVEGHSRYQFVHGDIADADFVNHCLNDHGIDAVVNFAAESHVDRSILDSGPFVQTNIVGTQVLLDASRQNEIKRYLQVSTDEVYGSLGSSGFFTETTPLAPNSPYSASKAAADLLVRSYCHTFGFPGIITRCSNNYGPYQFPEKLLPLFIANALEDRQLPVYGDGRQVRDWIHVSDHCRGIAAALHQSSPGEVYNFGGECELENLRLTETLLELLNKPDSLINFVKDRPGHDRRYAIDCAKAKQELGWQPRIPFETGLKETIEWYLEHQQWTDRIRSGEYRIYYDQQYRDRS
ncbi:dTDP-glucose 4,6-dehydratase [Rubinisphaera margarita]|uniref:dTDP-glucose 4,6-dehydratase n=1 Tax=Rubinisphaera margarita TaxID=2909586 RepID=UPI001EE8452B|nr:dTDP-glucose 4,6-dehydratase [Rubinisphaera margarita]MCG6156139.1 dTDP-glucose 4,6-dehydratase [Rubinisphaera margarita]